MRASFDHDVAIIGGGPAGLAAALTLARYTDLAVALYDRSDCSERVGEMVPAGAKELLAYLGLAADEMLHPHLGVSSVLAAWGSDRLVDRPFLAAGVAGGWHLDRRRFEHDLRAAAALHGVARLTRNIRSVAPIGAGWRIADGAGHGATARFVIDASGRHGRVLRSLCVPHAGTEAQIAIWWKTRAMDPKTDPYFGATLIETVPEGWWYSAALPEGRLAVALVTDPDLVQALGVHRGAALLAWLDAAPHSRARLGPRGGLGAPTVREAGPAWPARAHGRDWAACGDAALAFDPLASSGIAMALLTGAHAGRLAAAACAGEDLAPCGYTAELDRLRQDHLNRRHAAYTAERRWPQAPFWRRRHHQRPLAEPA